jgi:hypothetical protein
MENNAQMADVANTVKTEIWRASKLNGLLKVKVHTPQYMYFLYNK